MMEFSGDLGAAWRILTLQTTFVSTKDDMEAKLRRLKKYTGQDKQKINKIKTKFVRLNLVERCNFQIDSEVVEEVNKFGYFGTQITREEPMQMGGPMQMFAKGYKNPDMHGKLNLV